jgi:nitrogen fixation/metabolism regulation signal transduction histidine kinase
VVMVDLLTQGVRAAIQTGILQSIAVSLLAVLLGILISLEISRSITRPVMSLADAARSLERGETIDSGRIAAIASGKDELADLAKVFDRMAVEVLARETNLKQQVAQLRIEIDESKKARQVAEITETDYFQALRQKAKQLRAQAEQ